MRYHQFTNYGQWIQPVLSGTFWSHWSEGEGLSQLTPGWKLRPMVFLNGHSLNDNRDVAATRALVKKLSAAGFGAYNTKLVALGKKLEREHLAVLKRKPVAETYLPELFRTYRNLIGIWWWCIMFGPELETYIRAEYPGLSDENIFAVTKPKPATWLEQQSKAVGEFAEAAVKLGHKKLTAESVSSSKKLSALATDHLDKFRWFGTHHWAGQPYTEAKLIADANAVLKRGEKVVALTKLPKGFPKDLQALASSVSYWRTHCAELTAKVVFESRPVLTALAKRWKLSYDELLCLSHVEIVDHLQTGEALQVVIRKQIPLRMAEYGCSLTPEGKEQITVGRAFQSELLEHLEPVEKNTTGVVKGMVASKGEAVTARVCVVMSPKDFSSFKKGDVLVTNETTPDFVPLMKLAAAVVTDRGGITSHAAIISRELQVPCIVGTGSGTTALSTGDRVTVDTAEGSVIKI